ncbi:MAG: beta-galactosidase [Ahrensia sp.]|nr:beta-galactosidase [Ahrensia sp.]
MPTLGVCYYPEHWPRDMWADDAARMVEAGISLVRIAEFAWSRLEPARDELQFDWLDEAIDILGKAGLKIILCTPTATPPKWLVDEMPDMLAVNAQGQTRHFGSRRHYSFSHAGYRDECRRITTILAKRYGRNDHVVAWQTDNEYGCHDTTVSYCDAARSGFRDWLARRYQSPDALNRAWGNVFWSMEVTDFAQIDLPNLTVTEANPAHRLDFARYTSERVVDFNKAQVSILRKHAPGRDIVHNFMGRTLDFDHFDVAADLDVASWDSYPIGFLEQFGRDEAWKNWYMRAGDPDFQAFHHDLYRGCGRGRLWVMEQQPGPVNWAPWNPDPHPGMVQLWSHEAFAHGAEVVSYFRWRQAPFAQEQMHTGLNRPDNSPDRGLDEAMQVSREIADLPPAAAQKARIALLFDYPSIWATDIQPQGADFDAFAHIFGWYGALRRLGQSIDIVPADANFDGYSAIIVPHLPMMSESTMETLAESGAQIVFGPRTGSRTTNHAIPDNLPPGPLQHHLPIRVQRVESLRPGALVESHHDGAMQRWFEHLDLGNEAKTVVSDRDDRPMVVAKGNLTYCAGWPNDQLAENILRRVLKSAGMTVEPTGDDLRIRDHIPLRTIVNYGPRPRDASHLIGKGDTILIGSRELPVAGVTIIKRA